MTMTASGYPSISPRTPKAQVSRQRKWQQKMNAQGLCRICAQPAKKVRCDACSHKQTARYHQNREKYLAYAKKYAADHKEEMAAYARAWRAAHPDYARNYRAAKKSTQP